MCNLFFESENFTLCYQSKVMQAVNEFKRNNNGLRITSESNVDLHVDRERVLGVFDAFLFDRHRCWPIECCLSADATGEHLGIAYGEEPDELIEMLFTRADPARDIRLWLEELSEVIKERG